ncbi:OTU domain-containing ubiquitin thioesterase [Pleurotus pulmonarius]
MAKKKKAAAPRATTPPIPILDNADDEDLMNELLAQLDSKDNSMDTESVKVLNDMQLNKQADNIDRDNANGKRKDPKGRFIARQARKAAALAKSYAPGNKDEDARLEREAKDEEKAINKICNDLNVHLHEINPDGHCLFSAVADQLALLGIVPKSQATYVHARKQAADYMAAHIDEFIPFLPPSGDEDRLMTQEEYFSYCTTMRDTGVWGGEPEILALSKAYHVSIHVIQSTRPSIVVHEPEDMPPPIQNGRVVRISYHRRMYGLGEHYNSLRPNTSFSGALQAIMP